MIRFLKKHVDKFAHYAVGNIIAFLSVMIMTLLSVNTVSINVISFVFVVLLAFWKEMVHDKKADEFDAIATVAGAMTILIIFNLKKIIPHVRLERTVSKNSTESNYLY